MNQKSNGPSNGYLRNEILSTFFPQVKALAKNSYQISYTTD